MIQADFETWLDEYCLAFPETAAWLNQLGRPELVLSFWEDALEDVDFQDARQVIKRMVRGDDDPVQAFDRDKTPAIVRKYAIAERKRRNIATKAPTPPEWKTAGERAKFNCGDALRNIMAGLDAGMSESEAIEKYLPPIDPENEPRYQCPVCLDRGLITVWSVRAMKAAAAGAVAGKDQTTAQVRCDCKAGSRYENLEAGIKSGNGEEKQKLCVYSDRKWLIPRGKGRAERIANLIEWMRGFRERQAVPYDEVSLPDYRDDAWSSGTF
jgi:hypothetical protein